MFVFSLIMSKHTSDIGHPLFRPHAYDTPSSYRSVSYSKPAAMKSGGGDCLKEAPGSTRLIPLWVQFLVFLLVAVFLYIVFANMESTVSDPFKKLN